MSMFNDIEWTKKGNSEQCISNFRTSQKLREEILARHWTFLGQGGEL